MKRRLIVGMTGASGAIYGIRLLEILGDNRDIETILVMSEAAMLTIPQETSYEPHMVRDLADTSYECGDLAAPIASGTYPIDGMIIAPCSIKTLSAVANAYTDNLLARAADVCLKERRRLVLMVRETPLHAGHLRLMLLATEAGAVVFPPVPALYAMPSRLQDLIDQTVLRGLSLFGVSSEHLVQWTGRASEARCRRD